LLPPASAAFGFVLDQLDLAPIDFRPVQFIHGILHVRVGRKLHNTRKSKVQWDIKSALSQTSNRKQCCLNLKKIFDSL
jgi:hypothetical protein